MMRAIKMAGIVFLIIPGVLFNFSCSMKEGNKPDGAVRPNIILLFSDELQFEDLGFCGGTIPTPNIDALAAGGLYFENTYTPAPMCTPSRFSLLSGRYPGRCSDKAFLKSYPVSVPYNIGWNTFLDSTVMTIPRMLSAHGYYTGMSGKWHISGEGAGFSHGLLQMEDSPGDPQVNENLSRHQELVSKRVRDDAGFDMANSVMYGNFDGFPVRALRYHNFPWITKGAMDFIEEGYRRGQPFFLYLTPTSLHGPHHAEGLVRDYSYTPEGKLEEVSAYVPDVEKLNAEIASMASPRSHRYTGMAFLDHQVGLVMEKLKELGIEEHTIVIFLPDHNTEPAKATCYEKGIRIPMVIKWPGKIQPASTTEARVQTIDLLPTILEMAGVPLPEDYEIDGESLMPVIEDHNLPFKKYIFAESGYTRSVSDGQYKYIAFRYPGELIEKMKRGELKSAPNYVSENSGGIPVVSMKFYPSYFDADQLFDLSTDPYEQENLAYDSAYTGRVAELQEVLKAHLSSFSHPFDLSVVPFVRSDPYRALVKESKKASVYDIPWYVRDWGEVVWPPVK
ncbi:MAG: sulfatase-like hydrolase/transferase [Bacteroidales bacterium]